MTGLKVAGKARFEFIQDAFKKDFIFDTEQIIKVYARVVPILGGLGAGSIVVNKLMLYFELFIASIRWLGVGKHDSLRLDQ